MYLEIKSSYVKPFMQVRMMDLERNIKRLSWKERHALFLRGICHMPSREVAALMETNHTQVLNYYNEGKHHLIEMMNGA